jgi:hypothetical protein
LKEQEVSALLKMVADALVAANELHIASLALAGVGEQPVVAPTIMAVAVLGSSFAGEEKDVRATRRAANPALLLASIALVEIMSRRRL